MILSLSDANFEDLVLEWGQQPVLVDFWSSSPLGYLDDLDSEYSSDAKIGEFELGSEQTPIDYGVLAINLPVAIIFKDGLEVERLSGTWFSVNHVRAALDRHI